MKIALSGSDSTGKTTLAEEIGKRFGIPVIGEYARETATNMGIQDLRGLNPDQAYDFQWRILERKLAEEDKHDTFIADRSVADNIAYYLRWCSRDIDDERNKVYVDRCQERLHYYDHIMVLPPGVIPLENDGFRSSKIYYQYEIHCSILGILTDNKIGWVALNEPELESRITILRSFFATRNTI